ncbi:MAG: hypothetical protein IIZ67_03220 [Bacilli bacterium]|nr:hypothetical protein [Bacilli bacterium]
MNEDIEKLKDEHFNTYKNAVIANIENNSTILVKEDLYSLINKPPLDSMDLLKNKIIDLAKKNKIVIDNNDLDKILDNYRKKVIKEFDNFIKTRTTFYTDLVSSIKRENDSTTIKILKKDLNNYNKKMKKDIKSIIEDNTNSLILKKSINIFKVDDSNINSDLNKFINKTYIKQFLENVDIKILVKDATLINAIKEQTERYQFTLSNSHLFN